MVQGLNEPLANWGEEMRGVPRKALKGMAYGQSAKRTRTIKLKYCGLTVALVSLKGSLLNRALKGLNRGFPAYGELVHPNDFLERLCPSEG